MNKELFNNKTVTQIGLVVDDIDKYINAFVSILGVQRPEIVYTGDYEKTLTRYKNSPTQARARLAFFELENITIELIEPLGEPSTWSEFLSNKGPGIHHIAFQVKSMDDHINYLLNKNGKIVQQGSFEGGSYAYVDMSEELGMILELLTSDNNN